MVLGYQKRSKYMAQSPKGRLVVQSLHRPIHGNCVFYFCPGVYLGGGPLCFLFSPLPGDMIQID